MNARKFQVEGGKDLKEQMQYSHSKVAMFFFFLVVVVSVFVFVFILTLIRFLTSSLVSPLSVK